MMFREIVQFIEGQTSFTLGTDLFAGHRPQSAPDRCVLIAESGGGSAVASESDFAEYAVQALTRAKTYFEARTDCWEVYEAIHSTFGWELPNWTGSGVDYLVNSIYALAIPQYIGQDENGMYEFSVNFIFHIEQAECGL